MAHIHFTHFLNIGNVNRAICIWTLLPKANCKIASAFIICFKWKCRQIHLHRTMTVDCCKHFISIVFLYFGVHYRHNCITSKYANSTAFTIIEFARNVTLDALWFMHKNFRWTSEGSSEVLTNIFLFSTLHVHQFVQRKYIFAELILFAITQNWAKTVWHTMLFSY